MASRGRATGTAVSTEELAAELIARGWLNTWQTEQLRHGRSKFSLGPYLMIDSIGQGGMGQVFKAEHTIMGRTVAVKVLPRSKSTPEAIAGFHREIRAQAQLDHPHLVRALDAGHDGSVHFLVTEYVPGTDLRKLVRRRGRLSAAMGAYIISQAASGLSHAHAKGMIHRDIKPGNILVTPQGQVKISDLGLVGFFDETNAAATNPGKIVGTADYLAPEQITTPHQLTPACDIYALGCTLYYAVTGKVPFPGGTTRDKARAHCHLQPLDPRRLNPELPPAFVETLADMMAKEVSARVQTAGDVIRRLQPWADEGAALAAAEYLASASHTSEPILTPAWPAGDVQEQDTQPPFIVRADPDGAADDSPSQVSQATHPVASAGEETLPVFGNEENRRRPEGPLGKLFGEMPVWLQFLVLLAGGATLLALGSMLTR